MDRWVDCVESDGTGEHELLSCNLIMVPTANSTAHVCRLARLYHMKSQAENSQLRLQCTVYACHFLRVIYIISYDSYAMHRMMPYVIIDDYFVHTVLHLHFQLAKV
jgi:hypothetical protein